MPNACMYVCAPHARPAGLLCAAPVGEPPTHVEPTAPRALLPPSCPPHPGPQALQKAVKQMATKAGTEGLVHGIKNPELRKVRSQGSD